MPLRGILDVYMSEPISYTSRTIESVKDINELLIEYVVVCQRLHGDNFSISLEEFKLLLSDKKELVSFVLLDGQLVATAQATLLRTPPVLQSFINNVVTHPDFGGRGLGRLVMESLETAVTSEWGSNGVYNIRLGLSNSPTKDNGGFYEKLGWTSRGPVSTSPTILWIKTI